MFVNSDYYYYTYLPMLISNVFRTEPTLPFSSITPYTPIYPQFFNPNDLVSNAIELSKASLKLSESAQSLMKVFEERSLKITGEGMTGTVEKNAPVGTYEIEVTQLATAQVNTGDWLDAASLDFSGGLQTFRITIGDRSYELSVNVTSSMTNLDVLEEIANEINDLGIGINAVVETEGSQARLVLTGRTGESNAFTIEDVTGNIVGVSGISNVTQSAQNLVYTFNGRTYENSENVIDVIPGVTLNVEQTGNFTVEVGYNAERILERVEEFAEAFNEAVRFARGTTSESLASVILENPLLERIGIVNEAGQLRVTGRFEEILQNSEDVQRYVMPALETAASTAQNFANALKNTPVYTFQDSGYTIYQYQSSQMMLQSMLLRSIYSNVFSSFA